VSSSSITASSPVGWIIEVTEDYHHVEYAILMDWLCD
jgi:hypothetical protein